MYFNYRIYINKIHEPIGKTYASKQFEPVKLQGSRRKTLLTHCLSNLAFTLDALKKTMCVSTHVQIHLEKRYSVL